MIDALLSSVAEAIFTLIWKFVLWPVVLVLATPVVVVYSCFAMFRYRQPFIYALSDGYSAVSEFWGKWAF